MITSTRTANIVLHGYCRLSVMRFVIERVRLASDEGVALRAPQHSVACAVIEADSAEAALASFLTRDDYEPIGQPNTLGGTRALLTVRKGRAFFALHVAPGDGEDPDVAE